jgi:hypothetical protein
MNAMDRGPHYYITKHKSALKTIRTFISAPAYMLFVYNPKLSFSQLHLFHPVTRNEPMKNWVSHTLNGSKNRNCFFKYLRDKKRKL